MASDNMAFPVPQNRQCKIWRYMDFSKYIWMLLNQSLFFSRIDNLDDPFEGSYSRGNEKLRPIYYKDVFDKMSKGKDGRNSFQLLGEYIRHFRKWVYVNCWHENDYESAAMWLLYGKTSRDIAIQSTYQKLFNCLPQSNTYVGLVTYADYKEDWIPEGSLFYPFMHKRRSFEHEREIRALALDFNEIPHASGAMEVNQENPKTGHIIPVDINELIEAVYVSPNCPRWFYGLVQEVSKKHGLNKSVFQSSLDDTPFY